MEAEIKKGIKCVRTDCSNDELVERAMESVLSQSFKQEVKSLLVADEYHMLSEEHKEELFNWISNRLNWLKVVIIANRSNGKIWSVMTIMVMTTKLMTMTTTTTTT